MPIYRHGEAHPVLTDLPVLHRLLRAQHIVERRHAEAAGAQRDAEILGVAGVSGNGQSELAQVLSGTLKANAGTIQYKGEDIPRLIAPIAEGRADVVIGNRDIENIKQFSWIKKRLQRIGSAVVRQLSGADVPDATTGFRAYSREAALRINIVSTYTYTIESIIQAGHKNLAIENIVIQTNPVRRPSRLFKSIPEYIQCSIVTMIRVWSMFNPLRMFLNLGIVALCLGGLLIWRFLTYYMMLIVG
ncbi:ATP-binding cassette domain-containing protein, partial [Candidatus Falkowbacteria bacterium]|nr:ATP-binding cassette domain-containing protein [Candidatus Falkowbacteria bacterium]